MKHRLGTGAYFYVEGDEVWTTENLQLSTSDHKHRIGSLEHRMDKAEELIEEIRSMSSSIQLLAQEVKQGEKGCNLWKGGKR